MRKRRITKEKINIVSNNLATVSFVTPVPASSDHPPAREQTAQNYVTKTINAIMQSQYRRAHVTH
jgi:hypothetical protein